MKQKWHSNNFFRISGQILVLSTFHTISKSSYKKLNSNKIYLPKRVRPTIRPTNFYQKAPKIFRDAQKTNFLPESRKWNNHLCGKKWNNLSFNHLCYYRANLLSNSKLKTLKKTIKLTNIVY